jgi:putative phosphoesterase
MQLSSGWNDESMRIVVLSDTHAPRFWKRCPPGVAEHLSAAEVILHAGDVCVASVLEELAAYAPVHAVLGNNDSPDVSVWGASETAELDLAGHTQRGAR